MEIHAAVCPEPLILNGDKCILEIGGNLVKSNILSDKGLQGFALGICDCGGITLW